MQPEEIVRKLGTIGRDHESPATMLREQVLDDRPGFGQHEVAVRDYGCGSEWMQCLVLGRGKARNRVAFIAHQSIGQFELLA